MKLKSLHTILTSITVALLVACGGTDDYSTVSVAPSTCILTSVELGKIPCVTHTTTADGRDSIYVATITGGHYPMSIDHHGGRVFNVDSLPYGCDAAKITFTTLASSGSLGINSLSQEVDTFFMATDSTDFRKPRKVTVYAANGETKRTYNFEVRVHKEKPEEFKWQEVANNLDIWAGVTPNAAFAHEGTLYAYGVEGSQPVAMTALASAPAEWNKVALDAEIVNPTVFNGCFYALNEGGLMLSTDGTTWATVSTNLSTPLLTIVAGTTALYGVTEAGFVSSTDGLDWTLQEADEPTFIPTENCSGACLPSPTDNTFEDIIIVGSREGTPVVWKLNVDLLGMYSFTWNYYPDNSLNGSPCPELPQRNIFAYDGATLLLGAETDGASVVRLSRDNGRTWKHNEIPQLEGIQDSFATAVDANHFVWIIAEGGKVLKGRFNRLGWAQQDRVFTE